MATGVLVLGIERATKLLGHLTTSVKTYDATIRLGVSTTTEDAEGDVTATIPATHLSDAQIRTAASAFVGTIRQRPSAVSAIKVGGVRSYARVRAGESVELPTREVTIDRFEIHDIRHHDDVVDVDATVRCSAGTYVRALARDLGDALGVGGHLTALRRIAAGNYTLADAIALPEPDAHVVPTPLIEVLRHEFAIVQLDAEQSRQVRHGIRIPAANAPAGLVGLVAADGSVIALSEAVDGIWKHLAVFG